MHADITADKIVAALKDTLHVACQSPVVMLPWQCYDGGSNMAGSKNGVKAHILKEELRALLETCS